MSEMHDLMLRSLDRIVDDTLDINARVAADGSASWPEALWAELDAQGMTAIGEVAEPIAPEAPPPLHGLPVPVEQREC